MLITLILSSLTASADVRFERFAWRADNTFELQASATSPLTFKGTLNDAERIELVSGPVTLTAKSFSGAFVALTFVEANKEFGEVVILERQNGSYLPIQNSPIQGKSATLGADVEGAIAGLKKMNGWDFSLAIRSMLAFFDANPGKKLNDFYDAVRLGHIRTVARPNAKGTAPPRMAPSITYREQRDRGRERQERERVARQDLPPLPPPEATPTPRRPERPRDDFRAPRETRPSEPRPYEPRNVPPYTGGNGNGRDQYPGQRITSGNRDDRPRRKPKTVFDLIFSDR